MTLKMLENPNHEYIEGDISNKFLIVFANTSHESPETYLFVQKFDQYIRKNYSQMVYYCEVNTIYERGHGQMRHVDSERAFEDMELFEPIMYKYGLFNISTPHCTRELKLVPINEMAKLYFETTKYVSAIGIRKDEPKRIKIDKKIIYPLYKDFPTSKQDVIEFWESMPFNLNIEPWEGNCLFCIKKGWSNLLKVAEKYPKQLEILAILEEKYNENGKYAMFRGNKTCRDLQLGVSMKVKTKIFHVTVKII